MKWTRADATILAVLVLLGTGLHLAARPSSADRPARLVIEVAGQTVATRPLLPDAPPEEVRVDLIRGDRTYEAVVEISGGRARILPLPREICPRGLCSHSGWLSRPGQAAVCVPNRLVVRVQAGGP